MKLSPSYAFTGKLPFRIGGIAAVITLALALPGIAHPSDAELFLSCFWALFWLVLETAWIMTADEASEVSDEDRHDDPARWW